MYSTAQVRNKFITYFKSKQHSEVESSSLIPADDPTLLFVNAGMVQFKDIFLGAKKPKSKRVVTSQRCVRAGGKHNDLDQVGYTARHHTFFEMLGNFSFGDYFKREAIQYAWDFLTKVLEIPKEKLLVTVFEEDDEAMKIWIEQIGVSPDKVLKIGAKDNFWQMGDTGPCGPCSEIFYDHGEHISGGPPGTPEEDGDRFIEIWNLVFMQFDKQADGQLLPLPKPCVDTGMGLERISSILQGKHNNYDIDLFQHIIKYTAHLLNLTSTQNASLKVIADHIRTCAFLISDGILPSNEGRGYVLRRIIRRAIRHGHKLGATETFFYKIFSPLCEAMSEAYPELIKNKATIEKALKKEELRFAETLETGMGLLNRAISQLDGKTIPGEVAFKLYDTYGFPFDLTEDVAREQNLKVDKRVFDQCMQQQIQRSKSSSGFDQNNQLPAELVAKIEASRFTGYEQMCDQAKIVALIKNNVAVNSLQQGDDGIVILDQTPFYAESGGQVGDKGIIAIGGHQIKVVDTQKAAGQFHLHIVKNIACKITTGEVVEAFIDDNRRNRIKSNHTATHLLHKVLQQQLGDHVRQKGSIVADDKFRFDFSHDEAITKQQLQTIEAEVNKHIRASYKAQTEIMGYDEALTSGAMALFGEKYDDEVRVLNFGNYSIELCGGTHVKSTGEIGLFKITSEASIAAGTRRIEALTGVDAVKYIQDCESRLNGIVQITHASQDSVNTKVLALVQKNKELEKKLQEVQVKLANNTAQDLWKNIIEHNNVNYLFKVLENTKIDNLRIIVDNFKDKYKNGVVVLANHDNKNKVQLICSVSKTVTEYIKAGDVMRQITSEISGKGGGRPDFAQGGGESNITNLKQVLANKMDELKNLINI